MGFIAWITGRNKPHQPPQQRPREQQPEYARQKAMREDAADKANQKPITAEIKTKADRALATIKKAPERFEWTSVHDTPVSSGTPAARLQKQDHQDKAQEALSPTDDGAGKTASQDKVKAPDNAPQRRPQTLPRRPPSWER